MRGPIVTTSWDDGHELDVRVARLLERYAIPGTFYIAPFNREFSPAERLRDRELRTISERFEIGAHTMTHPELTSLTPDQARQEISGSRSYLAKLTSQTIRSFCYPRGMYRDEHVEMAARAGFSYARTVRRHIRSLGPAPLEAATTVHAYQHLVDVPAAIGVSRFRPLAAFRMWRNWDALAIEEFDRVLSEGGVFHLWGHSWEVDRHGDWRRLERVLEHISARAGVRYVDNGALAGEAAR